MNYDELGKLNDLRDKGAITEEEFQREKERLLNSSGSQNATATATITTSKSKDDLWGMSVENYCMLMHISQLFPVIGTIASIFLWIAKKDVDSRIDAHGKNIVNWIISLFIYFSIFGFLSIIGIGVVLILFVGLPLAFLGTIFAIVGAVKATNNIIWRYPFSISLIK